MTHEEREARRNNINLNNEISTPMTRKDGKPVTINDIFAHQKEAILMGKLLGIEESILDRIFRLLKNEITTVRRYTHSLRSGWGLTLKEFIVLAPLYKNTLNGCTKDGMQLLLLQIRKDIMDKKLMSAKRFKKREKNQGTKPIDQATECENPDRLTPLDCSSYNYFLDTVNLKRYGIRFYHLSQRNYSDTFKTLIGEGSIVLYVNEKRATKETCESLLKHRGIDVHNVLRKLKGGDDDEE
jgi:hypothetical protein